MPMQLLKRKKNKNKFHCSILINVGLIRFVFAFQWYSWFVHNFLCKCLSDPLTSENKCSISLIMCIFATQYIFLRKSNPRCQDERYYPRAKHIQSLFLLCKSGIHGNKAFSEWLVIVFCLLLVLEHFSVVCRSVCHFVRISCWSVLIGVYLVVSSVAHNNLVWCLLWNALLEYVRLL